MTTMSFNGLPEGTSLDDLIRREHIAGLDLRFCRDDPSTGETRDTVTCAPPEAEFATLYAVTDRGTAIAIHDVDLTSGGADVVAAIARALFVAIVNARCDEPDAARTHAADPAAPDRGDRIE